MSIDPKYIIHRTTRKGQPITVVKYAGVLDAAHDAGLESIETQLLQLPHASNGMVAVVKAHATFHSKGVWEALGDASPDNVEPEFAGSIIRIAETRAKARALSDAINAGDELADAAAEPARNGNQPGPARQTPTRPAPTQTAQPANQESTTPRATKAQIGKLQVMRRNAGRDTYDEDWLSQISMGEATALIDAGAPDDIDPSGGQIEDDPTATW